MKRYDKYKESGISWIGEIPEHWEEKRLKLVASCNDETLTELTHVDQIIRYVEISDVNAVEGITNVVEYPFGLAPSRARRKTKINDVIVSTVRTYLRAVARVTESDLIVSTGFAVLRAKYYIDSLFLAYIIQSSGFIDEVIANSSGVNYPAITANKLTSLILPLPPLAEQEAIVAYLEGKVAQMDHFVAKQEAQIAYLRELKQAVIAKAVTQGIDPQAPLRPSGIPWIGDIPEHWEVKRLKSLLCKTFSGEWGNEPTATSAYRCIRIADFDANLGSVFFRTEPTFRSYTRDDIQDKQVLNGDVLLEKSGGGEKTPVGRAVIWNTKDVNNPCMCANFIQVLRTKLEVLQPSFLMLLLSTIHAKDAVKLYIKQTIGIQNLTLKSYMSQPIPLPPSSEQEAIVTYINRKTEEIDRLIAMTEQEIARVRELKQTLIADAVTGRINVQPS